VTNADADAGAVAALREALETAENAGDADAAAALFTDDAVVMVPDFPVQEGKAACASFMREIMGWLSEQFDRHIAYVSAEVAVIGDMAFDRGTFSFTVSPKSGADSTQVTGKYLWLLRRTAAESWRVARLIVCRDDECDSSAADVASIETSIPGAEQAPGADDAASG
jgi:uncharacterized protein (TIGR02246 family)